MSREWTAWTIVFDAERGQASFFTRSRPGVKVVRFAGLEFSPGAPVRMLDVNTDRLGDLTGALVPYSHKDALSHMTAAFRVFSPSMTPKDVDSFLRFLESGAPAEQ